MRSKVWISGYRWSLFGRICEKASVGDVSRRQGLGERLIWRLISIGLQKDHNEKTTSGANVRFPPSLTTQWAV